MKDKAGNFVKDQSALASIAGTGFGLSAMTVGAERGWISKNEAEKYSENMLRFALTQLESEHGFLYHFLHWETGKKTKNTELSSIDTAIFLAGALTAGQYFKGTEVEKLANQFYERVDFEWMLNGGKTLSMGWDPIKQGFLRQRWSDYNESLILYLLAIGSPTHPISPESWREVNKPAGLYGSHVLVYSPPLFTHQYSQIWLDLRGKNDGFADYFENSKTATLVNREFCIDQSSKFKTYSENVWGLTASLGPGGYRAYGSPPGSSISDGTVAPTAAGSSMVFTPELSLQALRFMYENFKDKLWGKYGPSDAFNLDKNWFSRDVLAIDQGPLLLMIENYRTGLIWKLFMQHPAVSKGLTRMGFKPGTFKLQIPEKPKVEIKRRTRPVQIDGNLDDWDPSQFSIHLNSSRYRELGEVSGNWDLEGQFAFSWDPEFLYLAARITDESIVVKTQGGQLWRSDLLELFVDPAGEGFEWKNPRHIQLGLSPGGEEAQGKSWVWPKNFDPVERGWVTLQVKRRETGYHVEAKISWKLLGIEPQPGARFGLSPALHDVDEDRSEGKLIWFFLPEGKSGKNLLGDAILKGEK